MKKFIFLILITGIIFSFSCNSFQNAGTNEHKAYKQPIKNFTQFDIYKSSKTNIDTLLGYDESLNYRVCDGKVSKEEKLENQIDLSLSNSASGEIGVGLPNVFQADIKSQSITSVNLKLINPVEIRLLNPRPTNEAFSNAKLMEKSCIGSVLRVDRIDMEITTKDGLKLSGEALLKKYEASGELALSSDAKSAYFAKNAYIGYKKVADRIDNLQPIIFDYQILHLEKGSKQWRLLYDKDTIQSGDYIKIRMKANYPVYAYLLNVDGQNQVYSLFPDDKKKGFSNPLVENNWVEIPDGTSGFQADNTVGLEELQIYVFRDQKPEMDELIKNIREKKITVKNDLNKQEVVIKTKGIGSVANTKVASKPETETKTGLSINEIRGLPSDYKQIIIYNHK